jgi:hypothetical protein
MPKVIVTDPKGFFFNKATHPKDAEVDIPAGARLDAALHFKQVEIVKEEPAKPAKAGK